VQTFRIDPQSLGLLNDNTKQRFLHKKESEVHYKKYQS